MKREYRWGDYVVEIDEAVTRRWYDQSEGWSCACRDCQNFLTLAKTGRLPAHVLSLLDTLGIPAEKATYVCMTYKDGDKLWYDFSYRLSGRIIKGDLHKRDEIACFHETYPYGAPGFPEPQFDLGFWCVLPWALEQPREDK